MNKFFLLLLFIIIGTSVVLSGVFHRTPDIERDLQNLASSGICLDGGAPNTSKSITVKFSEQFSSTTGKFNLIKTAAALGFGKSTLITSRQAGVDLADNQPVYYETENIWGNSLQFLGGGTGPEGPLAIVYKLSQNQGDLDTVKKMGVVKFFDIYLRDGLAIPDFIKNCKSWGANTAQTVVLGKNDFPPGAFKTSDIIGKTIAIDVPSFVYNNLNGKKRTHDIEGLDGIQKNIGSLVVSGKTYPLHFHLGNLFLVNGQITFEYIPNSNTIETQMVQNSQGGKKTLQLETFDWVSTTTTTVTFSWWTPPCKPVIYLYPKEKTKVNVKVNTTGFLTMTIPNYPKEGWTVVANPDGKIELDGKVYPYLYYESMVPDSKVKKSKEGFVIPYYDLSSFYRNTLPGLGLSKDQTMEFAEYWEKALPYYPYYFIRIMTEEEIEAIEPLIITPSPDTILRVRFYFEPLDRFELRERQDVPFRPSLQKDQGFKVVEWGGMVKRDKDHPFTCSE